MLIGSASIAPKVEIAAPKATVVSKPVTTTVQPHLVTSYTPPKSTPVNLSGGANQAGGTAPHNPAGNYPQQWGNTCGANTLMSMEASADPARAAQLSALTGNDRAEYEFAVMNSNTNPYHRGFQPSADASTGWGFLQMKEQVGNRFTGGLDNTLTANDYAARQGDAADALVTALSDTPKRPVAIGMNGHWMSATDIRGQGDSAEVLINDSWTGNSAWVPVSQIRNGEDWVTTNFHSEVPKSSTIVNLVVPATGQLDQTSTFRGREGDALAWAQERESGWTKRPNIPTPDATTTESPATTTPVPSRWFNRAIAV